MRLLKQDGELPEDHTPLKSSWRISRHKGGRTVCNKEKWLLRKTNVLQLLNNSKLWYIWWDHVSKPINKVIKTFWYSSDAAHIPSFTKCLLTTFPMPDPPPTFSVKSMKDCGSGKDERSLRPAHPGFQSSTTKHISSVHWAPLPSSVKWGYYLSCRLHENSVDGCTCSTKHRIQAQSRSALVGIRGGHN